MPFRKMRGECGYGKKEKKTLGEEQEQDRKGDNRKNTEIKGAREGSEHVLKHYLLLTR